MTGNSELSVNKNLVNCFFEVVLSSKEMFSFSNSVDVNFVSFELLVSFCLFSFISLLIFLTSLFFNALTVTTRRNSMKKLFLIFFTLLSFQLFAEDSPSQFTGDYEFVSGDIGDENSLRIASQGIPWGAFYPF